MSKILLPLLMLSVSFCGFAQQELTDSITHNNIHKPLIPSVSPTHNVDGSEVSSEGYNVAPDHSRDSIANDGRMQINVAPVLPGQATLMNWGGGGVVATGQQQSIPGLMGIESGNIALIQQLGDFTLTAHGAVSKYGYYRGLSTQWGFGGSLSYRVNDNLSFTAFGSYASNAGIYNPALVGNINSSMFGGYANYLFGNSHFGMKVGAQSYYSVFSQHWQAQPIVMPYYRTNGGAEIGVDVGGILYNVLRSAINGKKALPNGSFNGSRNPTIDPRPTVLDHFH
jgi:hypothetical protein